ncbi:MAG: GGDEF domain-containing protein [Pirellulaceae bacterium]|nr:GGDEF domain-containing protein [Pirellulaceae bacterium]
MDFLTTGLPVSVALAAVAVLGYLFGRSRRPVATEQTTARRELKRALAIIRDLETISQHVRRDLAQHHTNLVRFRGKVDELARQSDKADWQILADEAERLLRPTQFLATQLAHAYDGIRQQAGQLSTFTDVRTDPLTGLCNRRALDETLVNLLQMLDRYGTGFAIAIFDIDHFKQINDTFGHLHGDRVLQQVATLLDQSIRETDTVARFGGEEFVALLPATDLHGAGVFAERIRVTVERLARVTISGGVTMAISGDDSRSLLARADEALYGAKADGRNTVFQHDGQAVLKCGLQLLEQDSASEGPRLAEIVA